MTTLLFFGSDQYSAVVLHSLLTTDIRLYGLTDIRVITDPKSPPNPVESLAVEHSLPVTYYTPAHIAPPDTIGLSASFPYLFPPDVISAFGGKLYNLHPSLLPQYRNVAPVPYALAMGDQETGITLQKIDEKIDHGEIITQVEEPILPTDDTPTLLTRLFTKGAQLFCTKVLSRAGVVLRAQCNLESGVNQMNFTSEKRLRRTRSAQNNSPLIFTRKLTGDSGRLEWPLVLKLIKQETLTANDTTNPLIKLRLTHHPDLTDNILPDLIRALTGYEKVWTIAPTRKGELRISFTFTPQSGILVLLPGKPRPIPYSDFTKYYL